jgi:hypothetical protein
MIRFLNINLPAYLRLCGCYGVNAFPVQHVAFHCWWRWPFAMAARVVEHRNSPQVGFNPHSLLNTLAPPTI